MGKLTKKWENLISGKKRATIFEEIINLNKIKDFQECISKDHYEKPNKKLESLLSFFQPEIKPDISGLIGMNYIYHIRFRFVKKPSGYDFETFDE